MGIKITPVTAFGDIQKLAATGDLWVINASDQSNSRNRGTLVFDVVDESGGMHAVILPDTWLPTNLANQGQTEQYLKSNVFRNLVSQKNIYVIDPATAEAMLSSAEAKTESKRVEEDSKAHKKALSNSLSNTSATSEVTIHTGSNAAMREVVQVEQALDNRDDNELHRLVSMVNGGQTSISEALEVLATLTPSIQAAKIAAGEVANTGSPFFAKLSDIISGPIPTEEFQGNE